MTPDQRGPAPSTRREVPNIHIKYLVRADGMPADLARHIVVGDLPRTRIVHGYESGMLPGRLTRTELPNGTFKYNRRKPGQGIIEMYPPPGVSADTEIFNDLTEEQFAELFPATEGRRIGITRYAVPIVGESDTAYIGKLNVYQSGIEGEVPGMESVAGRMIVIVNFDYVGEAVDYNNGPKPDWLGRVVTKPFSSKKLAHQLLGESERTDAPYILRESSHFDDLGNR